MKKKFLVKPGDVVIFKGVSWIESHWEFGSPTVVYSPVLSVDSDHPPIDRLVEDICIDLCVTGYYPIANAGDVKEFKWRGWSLKNLARRKKAKHEKWKCTFYLDKDGELAFTQEKVIC